MPTAFFSNNSRTLGTLAVLLVVTLFGYSDLRTTVYIAIEPFFMWLETTWFGVIGKTWGPVFAVVQAGHLLGLAVLGGSVLAADGRLLNLFLNDIPAKVIVDRCHRVFFWALISLLATGIFMACGVAMKIYFLPVYWFKMLALGAGILFHYFVRKPLLAYNMEELNPVAVKMVAIASILVWFLVAATGRWIGFSG